MYWNAPFGNDFGLGLTAAEQGLEYARQPTGGMARPWGYVAVGASISSCNQIRKQHDALLSKKCVVYELYAPYTSLQANRPHTDEFFMTLGRHIYCFVASCCAAILQRGATVRRL